MYLDKKGFDEYVKIFKKAKLKQVDIKNGKAREIYYLNINKGEDCVIDKLKQFDGEADFEISHQETDGGGWRE